MNLLRLIYRLLKDFTYLCKIYLNHLLGKKIVFYNKPHPIFTTAFEEYPSRRYVYFCPVRSPLLLTFNSALEKRSSIYYLDAATYFEPKNSKPVIVECEALPAEHIIRSTRVRKIFVESLSAGRFHLDTNTQVELLYPSIRPQKLIQKSDEEYITILTVGYGAMIKGFDVLFEIYTELKNNYKIKLIIAGAFGHNFDIYPEVTPAAHERAGLDSITEKLMEDPNVIFKPFTREHLLTNIYPKADLYIHLCRMETFGFSILEAMSFGLPIIASNFKAIPEMVEHGKNGFLVSAMRFDQGTNDYSIDINSREWFDLCKNEAKEHLIALLENGELRKKMGKASLLKVTNKFNIENKVSRLEEYFTSILE